MKAMLYAEVEDYFLMHHDAYEWVENELRENYVISDKGFIYDKRTNEFYCGSISEFTNIKVNEYYRKRQEDI